MSSQQHIDGTAKPNWIVDLSEVDVVVQGAPILHDINWQLRAGERWALFGANGAGKSTLLRLIAGELWPAPHSRGRRRYHFDDGIQRDAVQARQEIVLVGPEAHDLYHRYRWNLTCQEVITTGCFLSSILRRQPNHVQFARVNQLLEEYELEPLRSKSFLRMSRGEQRRILIARALAASPRVLLLDEVCGGLDAHYRERTFEMIDRAADQGVEIVYSTHDDKLPDSITHCMTVDGGRITSAANREAGRATVHPPPSAAPAAGAAESDHRSVQREALISLKNVDVYLDEHRVLNDLSWTVYPGQHWLITGANGSGKSTLLRLLHAQLRPALGGSLIRFGFDERASVWEIRRSISWMSPELQARYLYPSTVEQCAQSGFDSAIGALRDPSDDEQQRVEYWLDFFALLALRSRPIRSLSYGMLRKVLIARAMVSDPKILLLDEPTSGLDVETTEHLNACLESLIASGKQLIFVTHQPERTPMHLLTDHLVLDSGRIVDRLALV